MRVESFIFYSSFYEGIKNLPDKDRLEMYDAICKYALDHEEIAMESLICKGMFALIKPQLDANYKRRQDGSKGGRPIKETAQSSEELEDKAETKNHRLSEAKTTGYPNEKPNVNVNVNENVNVNDNSNELFAPSSDENDAVAKIPLNKNGTFHLIFPSDIEYYKSLYPAVDVEQEIRTMVGWCDANPSNRKTKSGVKRFIANWLSRAQNHTRAYSERNKSGVNYIDIE